MDYSLQTYAIWGFALVSVCYALHRLALPKPLKGIPYNPASATRILGDAADAARWMKKNGDFFSYIPHLAKELNVGPVFQMFLRPFGHPYVICLDPYEAYDVRVRRLRDFDRSLFFGDVFLALLPDMMVHLPTGPEWRAHRKLMNDTMSTPFLHQVAGPQMWKSTMNVIELWKVKGRLAEGRPWNAMDDIYKGALDIIWAGSFGAEIGSAKAQIELLQRIERLDLPEQVDTAVHFPTADDPQEFQSILTLSHSLDIPITSMFPRLAHSFALTFYPSLRRARKTKDRMIQSKIRKASEKFSRLTGEALETNRNLESALDLIIARETQMAAKENRAAVYDSTVIQDELFGFLIAGHETTSTTICWTLKFLSKHQDVQHKLRQHFRSRYRRATEQRDNPSMEEIAGTPIPYLDAIMEEAQRVGLTAIGTMRVAVQDTELLGYSIPKGTDVFFFNNGPGCVTPEMPVDAGKRSKSSAENMGKLGSFGAEDIEAFRPARWLAQDESGVEYFNANAGPSHPFGNGPRGCFGKKWALLEMRIILTLVFWNFELGSVSGELSDTGAIDGITHRPRNCYVSLKPVV